MMESYIAVLTKGICQSEENGSFLSKDFDARKAYLAGSIKGKKKQKKKTSKQANKQTNTTKTHPGWFHPNNNNIPKPRPILIRL